MRVKSTGVCLLTGETGPFVRSHIIPRFVGDKALGQAHRIQFGESNPPKLLFNSWTDDAICVAKGEERLRDIDTAAARIFKKHGLSWRHFPLDGNAQRHSIGDLDSEFITVPDVDIKALRLFFLSVLWRSAVSTRFEFAEIFLGKESTERLRMIVVGAIEPDDSDFPSVLVLLTDPGEPQVHGPLAQTIDMQGLAVDLPNIPIFRFFFDGLIVHMGRAPGDDALLDCWGARAVGSSPNLSLIGRPYAGSSQQVNLQALQDTLHREHPEQAARIYRALWKIDSQDD